MDDNDKKSGHSPHPAQDPIDAQNPRETARREALKRVMAGGGFVASGTAYAAGGWVKPVVETVVLPAHAQTTGPAGSFVFNSSASASADGVLGALVPSAHAACQVELCIHIGTAASVQERVNGGQVSTGSSKLVGNAFSLTLFPSGSTITGAYNASSDDITGNFVGCLASSYRAERSTDFCGFSAAPTTTTTTTTTTEPTSPNQTSSTTEAPPKDTTLSPF